MGNDNFGRAEEERHRLAEEQRRVDAATREDRHRELRVESEKTAALLFELCDDIMHGGPYLHDMIDDVDGLREWYNLRCQARDKGEATINAALQRHLDEITARERLYDLIPTRSDAPGKVIMVSNPPRDRWMVERRDDSDPVFQTRIMGEFAAPPESDGE